MKTTLGYIVLIVQLNPHIVPNIHCNSTEWATFYKPPNYCSRSLEPLLLLNFAGLYPSPLPTVAAEEWLLTGGNTLGRLSGIGYLSMIDFFAMGTSGNPLKIRFLTFASFSAQLFFSYGLVSPPPRPVDPSHRDSTRLWRELEPDLWDVLESFRETDSFFSMTEPSSRRARFISLNGWAL